MDWYGYFFFIQKINKNIKNFIKNLNKKQGYPEKGRAKNANSLS